MPIPREDVGDLLSPYPVSAAVLEGSGATVSGRSGPILAVRDGVAAQHGVAVGAVTGTLEPPMAAVVRPVLGATRSLSGAAGAAVRRWADGVAAYDSGIARLNERWRSGVATNFGVGAFTPVAGTDQADQDAARTAWADRVDAARSALLAELRAEQVRLEQTLDQAAQGVAGLLDQGPTAENLTALFRSGDLLARAYLTGTPVPPTGVDATVARLIDAGVLPAEAATMDAAELRQFIIDHPDVARQLLAQQPFQTAPGSPEAALAALLVPYLTSPENAAAAEQQRQRELRALFEGMDPDDAARLALLFPAAVGNRPGVPFEFRATANTVAVVVALDEERARLAERQAQDAENESNNGWLGWNSWDDNDMDGLIDDSEGRIALYESILADNRQILYFDPSEDGAIAELHGTIGPGTRNVGVLVPGTTTDLGNVQGVMDTSQSFVDANPDGSLAMITWMGGDLPDSAFQDAPFNHYATDLAPSLAGFSHQLRDEIDASAPGGASVTVAGHSYGGAVVGTAERFGLDADRVLHIESAGMGAGIDDPDDLPASQSEVDRYAMTAPGDPIDLIQGTNLSDSIGHGGDPDVFPGTTRLATGNYADGSPIEGSSAHGGVFNYGSDAWHNMYEVFTGGTVTVYEPPEYIIDPSTGMPIWLPDDDPPVLEDID